MVKNSPDRLRGKVIDVRGTIINDSIVLERLIDAYIANYFTQKDQSKFDEMLDLILSNERMSFEGKKQVFCFIIKGHNLDFQKKHPELSKDLSFIIEQRNILAHYLFDLSENSVSDLEKGISFIKFKNSREIVPFDNDKILDIRKKIIKYVEAITVLLGEVTGQNLVHPPLT